LLRTREDASILTSSLVLLYISYLQWSALASNPRIECNPFDSSSTNTILQIILGLFFTFISLIIISGSTKKSDVSNMTTKMNNQMMEDEEDDGTRLDDVEKKNGKIVDAESLHAFPIS
jgi:TRAP-type C4-dicarboxylate transport system permease small subunit